MLINLFLDETILEGPDLVSFKCFWISNFEEKTIETKVQVNSNRFYKSIKIKGK